MALRLEDKKALVAEMTDVASTALSAVAADYRGLTVSEMTQLRVNARENNVYLRVIRNNLAKRALQETDFACLSEVLVGPLFLAFSKEDPGAAARVVSDFAKDHNAIEVKGLALNGQFIDPSQLSTIASLPTLNEALASLARVTLAPVTQFVRTLNDVNVKLVRTIAAVRDQKQASA